MSVAAPVELVDYRVWCANRGLVAFGLAGTTAGDVAAGQHRVYMQERQEWAGAHGFDEDDLDLVGPAPFDLSAI
jgi:hypothetical protein